MELISHMRSGHDIMHIPPNDSFLCHSCPTFKTVEVKITLSNMYGVSWEKNSYQVASVKPTEVVTSTSGAYHACLQPIFQEMEERMPQFCKHLHTYEIHLIQLCVSYYSRGPWLQLQLRELWFSNLQTNMISMYSKKTMKQQGEILITWHQTEKQNTKNPFLTNSGWDDIFLKRYYSLCRLLHLSNCAS